MGRTCNRHQNWAETPRLSKEVITSHILQHEKSQVQRGRIMLRIVSSEYLRPNLAQAYQIPELKSSLYSVVTMTCCVLMLLHV